ncbi:hypothetical protein [Neobacillus vireti]|uniref:hypothetical protein n=1 Tax=Neobacillus vireti TaxID=220686 RepID=UPI003000EC9D
MSKIAIIGFHNLHLMQFLYKYTELLDANDIAYDVIYWDRDIDSSIKVKKFKGTPVCFRYKMDNYQPKYKKIIGFLKCLLFVKKTIKRNRYDKLIFLTTQTALPLYLTTIKYKGKYIFDYRDITFEDIGICKRLVRKIIDNSVFTAISSRGFVRVLGDSEKFITAHNCSDLDLLEITNTKKNSNVIRIVFWGMVRQIEFNKKVCDMFANDDRFEVLFHGEGYYLELQAYCSARGYHNITFTGRYSVEEIKKFASNADILMNLYDNDKQQKWAMTVKLYDGIRYQLPMLITKGSYMAEYLEGYKFAYPIEIGKTNLDDIEFWYRSQFNSDNSFEKIYENIINDEMIFKKNLIEFVF